MTDFDSNDSLSTSHFSLLRKRTRTKNEAFEKEEYLEVRGADPNETESENDDQEEDKFFLSMYLLRKFNNLFEVPKKKIEPKEKSVKTCKKSTKRLRSNLPFGFSVDSFLEFYTKNKIPCKSSCFNNNSTTSGNKQKLTEKKKFIITIEKPKEEKNEIIEEKDFIGLEKKPNPFYIMFDIEDITNNESISNFEDIF